MTMSTGRKTNRAGFVDSTARAVSCSTGAMCGSARAVIVSRPVISAEAIRIRFVMMRLAHAMDASNVPPPRGAPLTDSRRSAIRDDLYTFDTAVGVACKSSHGTRENRRVFRKRPAPELRALVVVERLLELRTRVHDERPVLRDRLVDRAAL